MENLVRQPDQETSLRVAGIVAASVVFATDGERLRESCALKQQA